MSGTLYIVATPIGNLEDITQRALRILSEVDLIAAEDTRHTRKLLTHYKISAELISYHEHNEKVRAAELLKRLKDGVCVALVSDAGTPNISDPGYHLIRQCREEGIRVEPIPGAAAVVAALAASGLPTDKFYFAGFPPLKAGKRQRLFQQLVSIPATLIFYESPHRITKTVAQLYQALGDRECVLAREMTKRFEEFVPGRLAQLSQDLEQGTVKVKGELVLLVAGAPK
jgi:16S rRNA (cytidine1402-2'-O)-methyltransferase